MLVCGPDDVPFELIVPSGAVRIQVMCKLCQSSRWIGNAS